MGCRSHRRCTARAEQLMNAVNASEVVRAAPRRLAEASLEGDSWPCECGASTCTADHRPEWAAPRRTPAVNGGTYVCGSPEARLMALTAAASPALGLPITGGREHNCAAGAIDACARATTSAPDSRASSAALATSAW